MNTWHSYILPLLIAPALASAAPYALAKLNPTKGSQVTGIVTFEETPQGLLVTADIKGLSPGEHGFHIHEFGDCSAPDASSAGGHFNPTHKPHGGPDAEEHHIGDLGNVTANKDGIVHYTITRKNMSLKGPDTIVGKSVIVHEKADDFKTQPTGNAGGRVACGVIESGTQP